MLPTILISGDLSTYFGSLNDPANMRSLKKWFSTNIEPIDVVQSGAHYTAAIPSAYKVDQVNPRFDRLKALFADLTHRSPRFKLIPTRLEVTADSEVESIGLLSRMVFEQFQTDGALDLYVPKAGQDPEILVPGRRYVSIHHEDPLHDHASPILIDFKYLELDPLSMTVEELPYEDFHGHLMDPKLG